jgi:membrane protease YdiL (CAAX protease family)
VLPSEAVAASTAPVVLSASLVAAGLVMARLVASLARLLVPGRNQFFARWGFSKAALVFGAFLVAQLLVPLGFALLGVEPSLRAALLAMVAVHLGPALLVARLARELDPEGLRSLGLRAAGTPRAALFGVLSYVLLLPGLVGVLLLWPLVLERFGVDAAPQESLTAFLELAPDERLLPLALAVLVLPFFEELLFRGFLQPLLVQNFREVGGLVLTSLVFAVLHGASAFLPVFALSLILGGVMLRTQRLLAAWAVHALHNGLTLWVALSLPDARELLGPEALLALLPTP